MARRHASQQDFEVVGMDSDPTPGDPDLMQGLITRYRDVGDAAEKALNVLKRDGDISRGRGEAIDALNKKIGDDLPDKLRKTATSYHDAAQAYTDYAPRLREAQETFDRAVDQANNAAPQANQTPTKLSDTPTDDERAAATRQQNEIDAGKSALSAAKGLAEQARQMRESAQRQCEDVLDRAAREAIPERNVFQKIGDFFKDFPFFKILLGVLVGIVALISPVVGGLLAGGLFAIQQISAIASGNFDLGEFVLGLVSLVPGGSLLKGIGGGASRFLPNITKNTTGSIKNIKSTIGSTKTVGSPLGNSVGDVFKKAGGDFTESAADEAANQAISGDGFDPAAIFGAGAGGAIGGVLGGGRGKGKGKGKPPGIPIKNGNPPGTTTRGPKPQDTETSSSSGSNFTEGSAEEIAQIAAESRAKALADFEALVQKIAKEKQITPEEAVEQIRKDALGNGEPKFFLSQEKPLFHLQQPHPQPDQAPPPRPPRSSLRPPGQPLQPPQPQPQGGAEPASGEGRGEVEGS
ncbi:putative T7SS-secreted protein [Streptomyces sp. cg40]|uniref:putative T7SS-secreted protein n=1 Tax=Streptomyces sp. cg40 TaxID=3419764 RepID=UPI003D05D7E8